MWVWKGDHKTEILTSTPSTDWIDQQKKTLWGGAAFGEKLLTYSESLLLKKEIVVKL